MLLQRAMRALLSLRSLPQHASSPSHYRCIQASVQGHGFASGPTLRHQVQEDVIWLIDRGLIAKLVFPL